MTEKLSVYDITPIQYAVLYCLWENDKRSPKEIAERLKLENSTISGILERMEKKGLIERNISKEDRRFIQVQLTKKGADLEKRCVECGGRSEWRCIIGIFSGRAFNIEIIFKIISRSTELKGWEQPFSSIYNKYIESWRLDI